MGNAKGTHIEALSDHDSLPSHIKKIFGNAPHSYLASNWNYSVEPNELEDMIYNHAAELCAKTYGKSHPCYKRLSKNTRGYRI